MSSGTRDNDSGVPTETFGFGGVELRGEVLMDRLTRGAASK